MISHRKRFIFVHIPKTGGTSVAAALAGHGTFLQGKHNFDSLYFKHATARDVKRMMGDEFARYFRFTVVRNPWDWAVSSYTFNRGLHRPFIRHTAHEVVGYVPEFARDWTFKHWLRWWIDSFGPLQSAMLTDEAGQLLVDEVIRFEEMAARFPPLCLKLRIWPRRLPHVNKTLAREHAYPAYYDDESREWVAQHFAEDIERFGYRFGGLK
jgi:hypothetical protein